MLLVHGVPELLTKDRKKNFRKQKGRKRNVES